ncbi:hypothetical protein Pcinc_030677 [Petrolisthes cinctipes]|uniref:Uncharacterized protein n=1 Tax=Petrolisthes cinctipes TaxID=88211 RepID=A0AAE1EY99_PETCI|nr:hypothetical protein Pcinc_030677 [Petrolisthes cinctipes]
MQYDDEGWPHGGNGRKGEADEEIKNGSGVKDERYACSAVSRLPESGVKSTGDTHGVRYRSVSNSQDHQ